MAYLVRVLSNVDKGILSDKNRYENHINQDNARMEWTA